MSAKANIVHENGDFWVYRVGTGHYEVLENVGCGSTRRATYDFKGQANYALRRATEDCDRRAKLKDSNHV